MKRVVVIGGGTGSFNVLSGLREYPLDITAVVTTFDSGGSTGVLRDEFEALPSGDIRRALLALSPPEKTNFLRELLQVRFNAPESGLHNHSFGNLLMLAAEKVAGNKTDGLKELSRLLSIRGTVLPVSITDAHVCVELSDGTVVEGETNIDIPKHDGSLAVNRTWLTPDAVLFKEAADAIIKADYLIFGPGDLYTSIIPNLLTSGFRESVAQSNAKKIYIASIMTKWGETHGMSVESHAEKILEHLNEDTFDAMLINEGSLEKETTKRYEAQHKHLVTFDQDSCKKVATTCITKNFMSSTDLARHNPQITAVTLTEYINL